MAYLKGFMRNWRNVMASAGIALMAWSPAQSAEGTFKTLYSFCTDSACRDGASPGAAPTIGAGGRLFGETHLGGAAGEGAIYELIFDVEGGKWKETVLYSFCSATNCVDGAKPVGRVILDGDDALIGATEAGGANNGGVIYRLAREGRAGRWTQSVLYSFCSMTNCADGSVPQSGPIPDRSGRLYGTTTCGGSHGIGCLNFAGAVYELSPNATKSNWTEQVLYSFCGQNICVDGQDPLGAVVIDGSGYLYGTAAFGGDGGGVVFKLSPGQPNGEWNETLLHTFGVSAGFDGSHSLAGLARDKAGNLFGTTVVGGNGQGTAFRLSPDVAGSGWTETILTKFCARPAVCPYGAYPTGGLLIGEDGDLIGTGTGGGAKGGGAAFKLKPNRGKTIWTATALHSFSCAAARCPSGTAPPDGLTSDAVGNLFGVTTAGAAAPGQGGSIFELTAGEGE